MIKRTLTLLLTASIISAAMLTMGFALMQKFTPALAAPLEALVVETKAQVSPARIVTAEEAQQVEDFSSSETGLEVSSSSVSEFEDSSESQGSQSFSVSSITSATTGVEITVAELLANPEQYRYQVLILRGIATSLNDGKILINDGTGQVLVEVKQDLVDFAALNGLTLTLLAKVDDSSSSYEFELEACTIESVNGTIVLDDDCQEDGSSEDDDMNDDMDDDLDDDTDDDMDDDSDDDSSDDSNDDMDDDSFADSTDDSSDDNS